MSCDGIERIFGMIGLARRAGRAIIGTDLICRAMPRGEVALLVVSRGASAGTKKKLTFKCEFYKIELIELDIETEQLGRLLGKTYTPAAVAITDSGIAEQIKKVHEALKQ